MSLLDDVISHLDGAQRYERYISACCPFHGDSHPSLLVYEDRFFCQACGERGTTQSLLKRLAGHVGVYSIETEGEVKNPFYKWLLCNSLKSVMKKAWENFNNFPEQGSYITNKRKISGEMRRSLGIGHWDGFYTFPIFDNGCLAGAFVRSPQGTPSRYFIPKGQNPNLVYFPKPSLMTVQGVVFVTFGALDAISVTQLGFAACSTTTGKQIDPAAFDNIRKLLVFVPDRGEEVEAYRIAMQLGWRGSVLVLDYPEDTKDPNDFLRKDADGLKRQLFSRVETCYA